MLLPLDSCAPCSGNNFYPVSNRWVAIVFFVVELWTWITLLGAPFRRYAPPTEELDWLGALQPWTFLSTFTIIFAFWVTLTMCEVLAKPFGQDTDTYNIDALIGGTEQTVFHNLRSSFNGKAAREDTVNGRASTINLSYKADHDALRAVPKAKAGAGAAVLADTDSTPHPAAADLPVGWEEKTDAATQKTYYFNVNTGDSQWIAPTA